MIAGAAVLAIATLAFLVLHDNRIATGQPAGVMLAVDANTAGNEPRTVGTVDSCASVAVGDSVDVDIVVVPPGIPADSGISGFQFTLFFDSQIVSVTAEDPQMLAAQAPNSSLLYFGNPVLPNQSGEHTSIAIDFGPSAIEPAGASETGPGVLSRITLLARAPGISPIPIRNVTLVDSEDRTYEPMVQQATIAVAQPCAQPTSSPPTSAPTPARTASSPTPAPGADPMAVEDFTASGGPPPTGGATALWAATAGVVALLAGAAMIGIALRLGNVVDKRRD